LARERLLDEIKRGTHNLDQYRQEITQTTEDLKISLIAYKDAEKTILELRDMFVKYEGYGGNLGQKVQNVLNNRSDMMNISMRREQHLEQRTPVSGSARSRRAA